VVYAKDRRTWSFRAYPDVFDWLDEEAERRGVSRNEVMNLIIREARSGVYTVYGEEGPKKHVPKRWWQDDE
jgi:hypothetical protein|tara:strand:+ start:229 stop:441 length:213 start_codon:yes stop_codon:yes gene_type:complete